MSSLLHQCSRMSNIFLKFSKFWLSFWTIWTEKGKNKFLEIISECHEMARIAKTFFWKFSKFWLFLDHLNWKTKKNSGNHLRMSWNGEKCKKKLLEILKILAKFWTIWTEKRKNNFLDIISECHEMARNAKKIVGNFQNFG